MAKMISDEVVREGHVLTVWNDKKPKFSNENKIYHCIHVEMDGVEFPIMLTDAELKRSIERAKKNPEDVPKKNILIDMLD